VESLLNYIFYLQNDSNCQKSKNDLGEGRGIKRSSDDSQSNI